MKKSESLIIKEFGLRFCAILSFTGLQYYGIKLLPSLVEERGLSGQSTVFILIGVVIVASVGVGGFVVGVGVRVG